jgi:hypothetical protein
MVADASGRVVAEGQSAKLYGPTSGFRSHFPLASPRCRLGSQIWGHVRPGFATPTTVALPQPGGVGLGRAGVFPMPIAPRPRVPGAVWQPSAVLLDASGPLLVGELDFDAWPAWARTGCLASCYEGPSLAADREHDPVLDLLARAVGLRSTSEYIPNVTRPPCGHLRGVFAGSGDVQVYTWRLPSGLQRNLIRRL